VLEAAQKRRDWYKEASPSKEELREVRETKQKKRKKGREGINEPGRKIEVQKYINKKRQKGKCFKERR